MGLLLLEEQRGRVCTGCEQGSQGMNASSDVVVCRREDEAMARVEGNKTRYTWRGER